MKIKAIQLPSRIGDAEANFALAEERLLAALRMDGADILVLPELWNTGFYPSDLESCADKNGERTQEFLGTFAGTHGVNIVGGSVAVKEADKLFNRMYVFNRSGEKIAVYDKVHLFSPAHEHTKFAAGAHVGAFVLDDVPMGAVICYDLRFGEWVRMTALTGAKVIFVPAAWPAARIDHWQLLGRARAVENQCYVVAVNGADWEGGKIGGGRSAVYGPLGEMLTGAGDGDEIIGAPVDIEAVEGVRGKITVFADRRPDLYRLD